MIRLILVAIFLILFFICSIPLLLIEWIIGHFNMDLKNRSSLAIVKGAFQVILFLTGVKVTVLGEENVPKDEAVLYVANHRSYFDILLTYVRVPRLTGYISKIEIERIPLLRNWMRNLHCLFLDRSDIKQGLKTILTGIEKIKSGISICIFPEGTRNKQNDSFLPFHGGSFKLAEKSGCPIVPIALNNVADIFEDHSPFIKKTHVIIEYGKAIYLDQLDKDTKKNLAGYVSDQIQDMYFKNQSLV
ncbi:MAG: 1-acyl-sn-glycerol-3-phosphate acyltransferase [Lachnospiraceae bacterium]|nr:1-acyl-sn-glycerol-3-phosphate acyltransferase [Lachnospiraceae bacterium]